MIVDAHCHVWPVWPYPRTPGAPPIDPIEHGSARRLAVEMDAAGVGHALVVAAEMGPQPVPDTEHIAELVRAEPDRWSLLADLDSRWSPAYHEGGSAERLRGFADRLPLLGITHYLADEPDTWFDAGDADAVGRILADRGLILSLHAPPAWHDRVAAWARRYPEVPILLHHQGLVTDAEELAGLLELATAPSVHVKVSGFPYVAGAEEPPYPAVFERLRRILDAVGPDRMLWGSDFPVTPERGIGYRRALDLVREGLADLGGPAFDAILGGTASRLRDKVRA